MALAWWASPKLWAGILMVAGLAWTHHLAFERGGDKARVELADAKAAHAAVLKGLAEKTSAALAEARDKDAQIDRLRDSLVTTIHKNEKEARDAQKDFDARVARADARAASLHDQLTTIANAYTGARDKAASAADLADELTATRAAAGMLAQLLGRCDRRAGARATFADAAHASGGRCERDYDAAKSAIGAIDR